jgi:hypothetical protein
MSRARDQENGQLEQAMQNLLQAQALCRRRSVEKIGFKIPPQS